MDKYQIDSHKLIYHIKRLNYWLDGKDIYPIYMELSPAGSCNHRCIYCALDFMEYQPRFLDADILIKRLHEMDGLGVRSIMYAGEGEPFLHKDMAKIIRATKEAGIDVAVTTNGVLFDKRTVEATLKYLSWVKVSIDAGKRKTYGRIHKTKESDFDKVMENLTYASKFKNVKGYDCALGMQIILLPDNYKEVFLLAKKAKNIGMDYLAIKPYSQHPLSKTTRFKDINYAGFTDLSEELKKLNSPDFNVIFRVNTMKKWDAVDRNYKHCLALPFWAYIDAGGNVWACSIYLGKSKFCLGNIYKNKFKQIWMNRKRRDIVSWAAQKLDTSDCRVNCRMDEINRYLWELKNPPLHVNFI